jgi:hypothetical protein
MSPDVTAQALPGDDAKEAKTAAARYSSVAGK